MPRPRQHPDQLCDLISGILTIEEGNRKTASPAVAAGKRQLESSRSFPEIWVTSICEDEEEDDDDDDDDDEDDFLEAREDVSSPCPSQVEEQKHITLRIASWLHAIEAHGFAADILRKHIREEDEEDDDTWWDPGLVRVFQPYYDLSLDEIKSVDGKTNRDGHPVGRCTVTLNNGDELFGLFKPGLIMSGLGSVAGQNMAMHGLELVRGNHVDSVLKGEGRSTICTNAIWDHVGVPLHLEGIFNDGYMEGPVRGLDDKGNLVFAGAFKKGIPSGPCWLAREGQGWVHGQVDERGRFHGDNILYIYPDLSTCMIGRFDNDSLGEARAARITDAYLTDDDILCVATTTPKPDAPAYTYCPSRRDRIPCDWLLKDAYETHTVECRKSKVKCAGDGLFAIRDIPPMTIVSYYNGLRVEPDEPYSTSSYSYQIYVDWTNTDTSAFVDIPRECVDSSTYTASLAHKANHSFNPNCQFIAVSHPRFGRIPALKTIKPIRKGDELFSHYKYDMTLAPTWYQEAWSRRADQEAEINEIENFGSQPLETTDY